MLRALPHFLPLSFPALVVLGWWLGGWWTFLTLGFLFGIIGTLDLISGRDATPAPAVSFLHRIAPMLWMPVQLGMIVWVLIVTTNGSLSAVEIIGMTISTGSLAGAYGITIAHELTHKAERIERFFADALLTSVTFHHFVVEHVNGHHRDVGTPADPATAKLGQSFYAFFPQTLFKGAAYAWGLEAQRLKRRDMPVLHWRNRVFMGALAEAAMFVAAGFVFGWLGVVILAGIGLVAIFQLEVINYIEHYGLVRAKLENGRFERVAAKHSWDDDHRLTNWLLYNLPRHADHHLRPGERYQVLTVPEGVPKLPWGYTTAFTVALIPPLWFRIMNPRALAARAL